MYKRTKNCECELMFLDSPLGLKISVVLIVKSMRLERCISETTTQILKTTTGVTPKQLMKS